MAQMTELGITTMRIHREFSRVSRGQSQSWITSPSSTGNYIQRIGLRENLQETIDFPIKYGGFL